MKHYDINVKWICPKCHGEYTASIRDRSSDGGNKECPYCVGRKVLPGLNSLADKYPELAKEWALSNDISPNQVLKESSRLVSWICPECGGEYGASIRDRSSDGYNTLADSYPESLKYWDEVANYILALDPYSLLPNSSKKAFWHCHICGHTYQKRIEAFALGLKRRHNNCPYCKGRNPKRYFF